MVCTVQHVIIWFLSTTLDNSVTAVLIVKSVQQEKNLYQAHTLLGNYVLEIGNQWPIFIGWQVLARICYNWWNSGRTIFKLGGDIVPIDAMHSIPTVKGSYQDILICLLVLAYLFERWRCRNFVYTFSHGMHTLQYHFELTRSEVELTDVTKLSYILTWFHVIYVYRHSCTHIY